WSQDGRPEYVPNELLIKLKDGVAEAQIQSLLATVQTETVEQLQLVPIYHVSVPNGTFLQAQTALTDHPAVEYVERNYYRYIDSAPNDPQYPSMWGLDNTGQTGGTPDAGRRHRCAGSLGPHDRRWEPGGGGDRFRDRPGS
ncbi:MAG: hypothetical protein U9Q81_00030, partial [Pseudomonadota bacterium]|nr:hypothetical protein [Pseudomonadota bacterium]